jgi:glucose/mannose-6-phosphate isomerase
MKNFTDTEAIRKIDPQNTLDSTKLLPKQLRAAWDEVNKIESTEDFSGVQNIIFCGMGASIYGALVLKSLLGSQNPYPTEVITDYHLPEYANENTLVVLTSYSGSTEEVLSCAEDAKEKGCKMLVLTKGGKLGDFAKANNVTSYIFDGALNPAGVPRLGNGYTILGLLGLLNKAKVITLADREIEDAITRLEENFEDIRAKAEEDYEKYVDSIPVIISAEHLSGNAQILRNQFNETSKTFSAYYLIPDLNHHLMEGLQFPGEHHLKFIILNTQNYSPKIQKRVELTVDVIKKNKHEVHEFTTSGSTSYEDVLEVMAYGSFLTLYLALYYDQNPAINPWVDWFKEELAK